MGEAAMGGVGLAPGARERGLTLLELLVTLGIIGVLAGLAVPGLMRAKQRATQAHCLNNLRQVTMTLIMFADDCGELPRTVIARQGQFQYRPLAQWLVPSYLPTDRVLWCGADPGRQRDDCAAEATYRLGPVAPTSSYTYNDLLPDAPTRARTSPVPLLWDRVAWHPSGTMNVALLDGSVESFEMGRFDRLYFNWYAVVSRPDPGGRLRR